MSILDDNQRPPQSEPPSLPKGMVKKIIIGIVVVVILAFGFSMFYTVEEGQRAAVITFGKFTDQRDSGLHFKLPSPIQKVVILDADITQRMYIGYRETASGISEVIESEAMMITGDENIISADAVVEWTVNDMEAFLFNIEDPEQILRNSAIASIRSVIGATKLDYAITEGKTAIQGDVRSKLIELMETYNTGILIKDLKFQDIEPPEGDVQQAFREVTNAREERSTKINNANKYSNDRIPKARGEAQALLEAAEAQKMSRVVNAEGDVAQFNALYNEYVKNPVVTEKRLILETLEQILPNAKIVITNGSSDTVNYLPLNELMKSTSSKTTTTTTPQPQVQTETEGGAAQ
jgi:membrane protease subunit HflK